MDVDAEKLIYAIEARSPIYNYYERENKVIVENLWEEVATEMKCKVSECKSKWSNLRNAYTRHLRNEKTKRSGSSGKKRKKWYLADAMHFLKDFINQQRTESSNSDVPEVEENMNEISQADPLASLNESTQLSTSTAKNSPVESKRCRTMVSDMEASPIIEVLQSRTRDKPPEDANVLLFQSMLADYEKLSSRRQRLFRLCMISKMNEMQEEEENEQEENEREENEQQENEQEEYEQEEYEHEEIEQEENEQEEIEQEENEEEVAETKEWIQLENAADNESNGDNSENKFDLLIDDVPSMEELKPAKILRANSRKFIRKCDKCDKVFTKKYKWNMHALSHSNDRRYKCPICERTVKYKENLKKHMLRHTNKRKYKCNSCEKQFFTSTEVKCHARTHTDERPYFCHKCGNSFKSCSSLSIHLRRHENVRTEKCEICEKNFFDIHQLKEHMAVHSSERPHACQYCSSRFSRRKTLIQHMKLHINAKEYACSLCDKSFNQQPALLSHMNNNHKSLTTITLEEELFE